MKGEWDSKEIIYRLRESLRFGREVLHRKTIEFGTPMILVRTD